jgi:hypothetical protein
VDAEIPAVVTLRAEGGFPAYLLGIQRTPAGSPLQILYRFRGTPGNSVQTIPASLVERVSFSSDRVLFLSSLQPVNVQEAPFLGATSSFPGYEARGVRGRSVYTFPLQKDYSASLSKQKRPDEYKRQGAVLVLGHVEKLENSSPGTYSAFEVYNLHAEFTAASHLGIASRFLFLPADAFFEGVIRAPVANLAAWDRELAGGLRLAALAGHDVHANVNILRAVLGTYPEILRLFSNHIIAPELTVEAITAVIRSGRTFIVFDYLADGTGFAVTYGAPQASPDASATLGDEVSYEPGHTLTVTLPVQLDDAKYSVTLVRDGQLFVRTDSTPCAIKLPGPGTWRVEVYRDGKLWIVASPIYVRGGFH